MVPRQRSHRTGLGSSEPVGLEQPPDPGAALERHPAASPCSPKPTRSFSTCKTACGRRVTSVGNVRWRKGGQRTLPPHPPALPNNRSGCRGSGNRLLADLGRSVNMRPVRPVTRCTRCVQRPRSRSAHVHDLPRSSALADGRVSAIARLRQSSFRNYNCMRERVKLQPWVNGKKI